MLVKPATATVSEEGKETREVPCEIIEQVVDGNTYWQVRLIDPMTPTAGATITVKLLNH